MPRRQSVGPASPTLRSYRVSYCSFESAERDNAEDFAEFVNGKQYGVAKVSELEDGRYRILVLIIMPVAQHLIYSVSGFMLCLSRVFLIDYQGWGSVVQRS